MKLLVRVSCDLLLLTFKYILLEMNKSFYLVAIIWLWCYFYSNLFTNFRLWWRHEDNYQRINRSFMWFIHLFERADWKFLISSLFIEIKMKNGHKMEGLSRSSSPCRPKAFSDCLFEICFWKYFIVNSFHF